MKIILMFHELNPTEVTRAAPTSVNFVSKTRHPYIPLYKVCQWLVCFSLPTKIHTQLNLELCPWSPQCFDAPFCLKYVDAFFCDLSA